MAEDRILIQKHLVSMFAGDARKEETDCKCGPPSSPLWVPRLRLGMTRDQEARQARPPSARMPCLQQAPAAMMTASRSNLQMHLYCSSSRNRILAVDYVRVSRTPSG